MMRLHMRINNTPAGWNSIVDTCLACDVDNVNSNQDPTGLCVTFEDAVDWKSRQLQLTAQLTTNLRNRHMIDAFKCMSRGMVV
jgi:hypothetical protein